MMKKITQQMADEINSNLDPNYAFKITMVEDDIANTGRIELKNTYGLSSMSVYLEDDVYSEIENFISKRYGCKTNWNNTRTIFWLTEEKNNG